MKALFSKVMVCLMCIVGFGVSTPHVMAFDCDDARVVGANQSGRELQSGYLNESDTPIRCQDTGPQMCTFIGPEAFLRTHALSSGQAGAVLFSPNACFSTILPPEDITDDGVSFNLVCKDLAPIGRSNCQSID